MFVVLAVLSAIGAILVIVRIQRVKERRRPELERLTRQGREQPLIFLSYHSVDLPLAQACAQLLQRQGRTIRRPALEPFGQDSSFL